MNIALVVSGAIGFFLLGFFFCLWCSLKAKEKEIKAGLFNYKDKAYKIEEIK